MSRKSKLELIAEIKALGAEVKPDASYNDLAAQLEGLQSDGGEESSAPAPERISSPSSSPKEPEEEVEEDEAPPVKTEKERIKAPASPLDSPLDDGDYLKQFQYRKQTALGSDASNPPAGSKAEVMKAHLLKQQKVRIIVPVKDGEDKSVPYSVTLNGYRLDLPRGVYIELPMQVADVIMESNNQTNAALDAFKIDSSSKQTALL